MASTTSRSYKSGSSSHLDLLTKEESPDLPKLSAYLLKPGQPSPGQSSLLRHPVAVMRGAGILTSFPSTTPFGLVLGVDSPCADERCAGTLGLSARGIFTPFIVTHVSIRTSDTSSMSHNTPSQAYRTLLYHAIPHLRRLSIFQISRYTNFNVFRLEVVNAWFMTGFAVESVLHSTDSLKLRFSHSQTQSP